MVISDFASSTTSSVGWTSVLGVKKDQTIRKARAKKMILEYLDIGADLVKEFFNLGVNNAEFQAFGAFLFQDDKADNGFI
jgi:hypothetical protein